MEPALEKRIAELERPSYEEAMAAAYDEYDRAKRAEIIKRLVERLDEGVPDEQAGIKYVITLLEEWA